MALDLQRVRYADNWGGLVISGLLFAWSRARSLLGGPAQPALKATTPPAPAGSPPQPCRILAIKFYGLGNIVMLLPVLGALRRAYPDAEIDFLTMGENQALLERSGAANQVIPLEVGGLRSLVQSLWRAIRVIRGREYDLVIDFEQFVKLSAIVAFLSGAPERIGFNTDGQHRGWLFTTRVVYTDSEHMSGIFMRLLRPLEIDTEPAPLSFVTKAEDEARVDDLLLRYGIAPDHFPIIAVHVGSGPNFYRIPLKRWPLENFAQLCDTLIDGNGAKIMFTGKGDEERALIHTVMGLMKHEAISVCDQLGIMELVAFLKRCHLTVVNDTSVMHLSAAVRTPVAAFFGPTAPVHYGPGNPDDLVFYRDLYCSPCLTNYNLKVSRCADPVCMRTIAVEDVLERIKTRLLAGAAG